MAPSLSALAHPRHSGLSLPLIIAIISGIIYGHSQGATVLETIIGAVIAGVLLLLVPVLFRQPKLRGVLYRHVPSAMRLVGAIPAKVTWDDPQVVDRDVYLPITNRGGTSQFSASVERVEGTADPFPIPFAIRWTERSGERREITRDATQRLYLAHVEPEGNADEYPIEYGARTKNSVEQRARHWKPGLFRFMGLKREHVVYLDLRDVGWATRMAERYKRQLRVVVRVRSADGAVNETRTVALGLREVGKSRHTWGRDDAVFAEIKSSE